MENPDALMLEAEKKKNHVGWFGGNKMEEAADLFQRAANAYKVAKKGKLVGREGGREAGMDKRLI